MEERLLQAVRSVLPNEGVRTFGSQVNSIKRVQRIPPSWNEIDFYGTKSRNGYWSNILTFPNMSEFRLAKVEFTVVGKTYKAVLSCIRGHIFDYGISPGPKTISFSDWDADPRVILLGNPLATISLETKEAIKLPAAWIKVLSQRHGKAGSNWELFDERTARRLAMDDGEFLILAECKGDQFVLYRLDPPSEDFFFLESHDASPRILKSLDRLFGGAG